MGKNFHFHILCTWWLNLSLIYYFPFRVSRVLVGVVEGEENSHQFRHQHPIAFWSKALGPKNRGLSTYEKDYLAILLAVEKWRSYLQHNEFLIWTYQQSLIHLNDQRLTTPWQHNAMTKLLGLQYKITYKKGQENVGADASSRNPSQEM